MVWVGDHGGGAYMITPLWSRLMIPTAGSHIGIPGGGRGNFAPLYATTGS